MTIAAREVGLQPGEYEKIEAAVGETTRGRRFLLEHERRARSAEVERMLDAVARLEAKLEGRHAQAAAFQPALVRRLEELSWQLRERGVEDFVCNKIDALAREFAPPSASDADAEDRGEEAPCAFPAPSAVSVAAAGPTLSIVAQRPVGDAPAMRPATAAASPDPRLLALLWLDGLPIVDRLALFA
jgi:hypothetical protein